MYRSTGAYHVFVHADIFCCCASRTKLTNNTVLFSRHLVPLFCNRTQYCRVILSFDPLSQCLQPRFCRQTVATFRRSHRTGIPPRYMAIAAAILTNLPTNLARFQPRSNVHRHGSHAHVASMTVSSRWACLSVYAASSPSEMGAMKDGFGTHTASNRISDIPTSISKSFWSLHDSNCRIFS